MLGAANGSSSPAGTDRRSSIAAGRTNSQRRKAAATFTDARRGCRLRGYPTIPTAYSRTGAVACSRAVRRGEPALEAILKGGNESVVAGLHCVDRSWTEDVETRTLCITADGLLLRFAVDSQTVSEGHSVSYGPQPAELFQVPPGYAPLLAPEGGPVP